MTDVPASSIVSITTSFLGGTLLVIDATLWANLEGFVKVATSLGICTGVWLGVVWAIQKHKQEIIERKKFWGNNSQPPTGRA